MSHIMIGNLILGKRPLTAVPLTDKGVTSIDSIEGADIIELRIDMFSDISIPHIKNIFIKAKERFNAPIIATCRAKQEGGAIDLSEDKRAEIISAVITITDSIDIEMHSVIAEKIINKAKENNKTSIVSYHNFSETPPLSKLSDLFNKGNGMDADIVKIAVMPNSPEDLRVITEFTLRYHDREIITIAMGDIGMASRIYLPMIGSLFTFASLEAETAPGQLHIKEIKRFLKSTDKYR